MDLFPWASSPSLFFWGYFSTSPVLHLKHKTIENFQIRGFGS